MGIDIRDTRTATIPGAAHQAALLREPVVGLRVLGSAVEHRLPPTEREITIGSAEARAIRLVHRSVSHLHARIERRDHHLILIDCDSKNGCYAEGERRAVIHLVPGARIRLGEVELVPFSHESDEARRVFQRYLGYGEPAQRSVEDAHHAATRQRHLVLLGPPGAGSIAFARSIHKHTMGAPWPLVLSPRLMPGRAGPRGAQRFRDSYTEQKQTLITAAHGTLALSFADWPIDPQFLIESIRSGAFGVRLILLGGSEARSGTLGALASDAVEIRVPALAARRDELSRVVTDAISEHAGARGASAAIMTVHDHERLLAHDWPRNHDEVEEVVERLTALRVHGKVRKAARALGMSPGSLSEWAKRYGFRVERWAGGRRRSGGE